MAAVGTLIRSVLAVATAAICTQHSMSAEPITLRYGQAFSATRSIFALPLVVADREGFFAREGLKIKFLIPIPGGADRQIDALHNDSIDISHVATPFLVRASLKGSDAIAVASEFNNPIYSLIAKSEIKSYADLRGRVLGLADEGGTITLSIRKLLAMNGIQRGEFAVRVIEGTSKRWACLRNGDCDAVVLGQPQDLQAVEQGYRLLGTSTEAVPELLYTVTAVRRSFAENHKDAMVRYVRGLAGAFRFIRDPNNRDHVARTIVSTVGVSEEIARKTMALFLEPDRGVLPKQGEINLAALARVIALMDEAGVLKAPLPPAERFVDLQYLQAAGLQ